MVIPLYVIEGLYLCMYDVVNKTPDDEKRIKELSKILIEHKDLISEEVKLKLNIK